MKYKILVVDDDEPMHIMAKNLLAGEFDLVHSRNAQEAIDFLSEERVNLILSDIHMPGISGLEFLESLMEDAGKKQTPVLIMTNLPTVEKEKKALDLGAADFIDKTLFTSDKEEVLKRVRMKLVTHVEVAELNEDLASRKNRLVSRVMSEAIRNNFKTTSEALCRELKDQFDTNYAAFWEVNGEGAKLVCSMSNQEPDDHSVSELDEEKDILALSAIKKPYLTNHIFKEDRGVLLKFSKEHGLSAEIGVPLFSVDERKLLMNKMEIPSDARPYGVVILKRNKLYSSKEYEMVSRLLTQTGSVLWRLYSKS